MDMPTQFLNAKTNRLENINLTDIDIDVIMKGMQEWQMRIDLIEYAKTHTLYEVQQLFLQTCK